MPVHPRRWRRFVLPLALLFVPAFPAAAHAAQVTFEITRIIELQCDEDLPETCPNDYYAEATINGVEMRQPSSGFFEANNFNPRWKFTATVPDDLVEVPVTLGLKDDDDGSSDDLIDITDAPGRNSLSFKINQPNGTVVGQNTSSISVAGTGSDSAQVNLTVSTQQSEDFDNDGIGDLVELNGFDDKPGGPHTDMAALGADPCRKTIALEVDWFKTPSEEHNMKDAAVTEIVNAFDKAPVPASANCPYLGYPKKPNGVGLIVVRDDALNYTDAGGANPEPQLNINGSSGATKLATIRDANMDPGRKTWFHYVLFGHTQPGTNSSGLCCDRSRDLIVTLGGDWTESAREQAGTVMHELGHALGLGHGGDSSINYKPNYLSVENYNFQFGLFDANPATADAGILDYSRSALPSITETNLSEASPGLNGANPPQLSTAFLAANGVGAVAPEFGQIDWNGDGDFNDTGVTSNVNGYDDCVSAGTDKTLETAAAPGDIVIGKAIFEGNDDDCDTTAAASDVQDQAAGFVSPESATGRVLTGYDDWSHISYRGAHVDGSGAAPPAPHTDITPEQAALVKQVREQGEDGYFKLSVGDGKIDEGNTGTKTLKLPVTLNAARDKQIEVSYTITGGPAPAATVPGDVAAPLTGKVTLAPNATGGTIDVPIVGDTVDEPKEEYATVTLSAPKNAVLDDSQGKVTIVDDDRDGVFTCRAIGLQVGTTLFADTAAPGVPCANATKSVVTRQAILGFSTVTAKKFTATTTQTPADLTAPPQVGDNATASSEESTVDVGSIGQLFNVTVLAGATKAECTGSGAPVLTNASKVISVKLNGRELISKDKSGTIALIGLTIKLNQVVTAPGQITHRALVFDYIFGPDVIIGETTAGFRGTAVHPNGSPCSS